MAGGGVDSTDTGLSLDAAGAGTEVFAWGFLFILKSVLKREKFGRRDLAGVL